MLGKLLNKIYDATPSITPAARKRDREHKESLERMDQIIAVVKKYTGK